MQAINGCAFCRSNRKPWTDHAADTCVVLANVECGYCHQKGHTPKKCPKSALKKQREAEWVKRQEYNQKKHEVNWPTLPDTKGKSETQENNKKATWSSLVVNSLSETERERMEQQHREQREKEAEVRRKEAARKKQEWEERKRQWEERNKRRIVRQYGLEADNGICPAGSFWYFFTESTSDDSESARILREDKNNQYEFKKYLHEKYWVNWLSCSEGTEDNCPILEQWRWEDEKAEYERQEGENRAAEDYIRQEEELINTMKSKLESGEITRKEYYDWETQKEIDDEYAYLGESMTLCYYRVKNEREYQLWKERSEARKKK